MSSLAELQPLIEPAAISWWPPAPGWYLLALSIPLALFYLWRAAKRWTPKRKAAMQPTLSPLRQAALTELYALTKPYDNEPAGPWLQQLNGLLKRLCRETYPHLNSHTLSGRAWLAFLDTRCTAAGLTRWMVLVEGAYKGECRLPDKSIDELQQAIETWIRKHV